MGWFQLQGKSHKTSDIVSTKSVFLKFGFERAATPPLGYTPELDNNLAYSFDILCHAGLLELS